MEAESRVERSLKGLSGKDPSEQFKENRRVMSQSIEWFYAGSAEGKFKKRLGKFSN